MTTNVPDFAREAAYGPVTGWFITKPTRWYHIDKAARECGLPRFSKEQITQAFQAFMADPNRPTVVPNNRPGVVGTGTFVALYDGVWQTDVAAISNEAFRPHAPMPEEEYKEILESVGFPYPPPPLD